MTRRPGGDRKRVGEVGLSAREPLGRGVDQVRWPPNSAPLLVAIMSSRSASDAKYDEAIIAEAATYVAETLTGRAILPHGLNTDSR